MLIPLKAAVPRWGRPWANVALMLLIISVSTIALVQEGSGLFLTLAGLTVEVDPATGEPTLEFTKNILMLPVLAVSSSFLHGDWLHLAGNMLFLWVFGNAVNYKFGHVGYLVLYLAAALVGGLAHYGLEGGPVVGASGAINGVMGAFLVYFPLNDVKVFYFWFLRFGTFMMSGIWLVLLYVAWDVLYLAIGAGGSTALWAHVGGFVAGFGAALLCLRAGWVSPTADEETLLQLLGIHQ